MRKRWNRFEPHCLNALVNVAIHYQKNYCLTVPTHLPEYWNYLIQKGYVSTTNWEEQSKIIGVELENMIAQVSCLVSNNWVTILKLAEAGKGGELCLDMDPVNDKPYGIRRIGTTHSYVHRWV